MLVQAVHSKLQSWLFFIICVRTNNNNNNNNVITSSAAQWRLWLISKGGMITDRDFTVHSVWSNIYIFFFPQGQVIQSHRLPRILVEMNIQTKPLFSESVPFVWNVWKHFSERNRNLFNSKSVRRIDLLALFIRALHESYKAECNSRAVLFQWLLNLLMTIKSTDFFHLIPF